MITTSEEGGGKEITRNIPVYKKISEKSPFPKQLPDIEIDMSIPCQTKTKHNIRTSPNQVK